MVDETATSSRDSERTYWLDLFTVETWREFLAAGGDVSGFIEGRWKSVRQMKPGDYLLCYLVGHVSRWVGILEVTSSTFMDTTLIWKAKTYPAKRRRSKLAGISVLSSFSGSPVPVGVNPEAGRIFHLRDYWDDCDVDERRHLIRQRVASITVTPSKARRTFLFDATRLSIIWR
jgi:hypothetical protein